MREQKPISERTVEKTDEYLICLVCGREVAPELCIWGEDEDGVYCRDCRAELESCGCSD